MPRTLLRPAVPNGVPKRSAAPGSVVDRPDVVRRDRSGYTGTTYDPIEIVQKVEKLRRSLIRPFELLNPFPKLLGVGGIWRQFEVCLQFARSLLFGSA